MPFVSISLPNFIPLPILKIIMTSIMRGEKYDMEIISATTSTEMLSFSDYFFMFPIHFPYT